jgi:hypothetical protein
MTDEEIQAWKDSAEAVVSGMKFGDQCPWCKNGCIFHDRCRIESLTARVIHLEAALKQIAGGVECSVPYASDHETLARHYYPTLVSDIEDIARKALAAKP